MKRRDALKNIGLSAGLIIGTPSIITLLNSCTTDPKTWKPIFLSKDQAEILKNIVDIIIPKTETPSASEVNVIEFLDKYYKEVLDDERQKWLQDSYNSLVDLIKTKFNDNMTAEKYKGLLDNYMILSGDSDDLSELLKQIKSDTIWAYKTSEFVGENILAYDPIPATYYCGNLKELTGGKSWSL